MNAMRHTTMAGLVCCAVLGWTSPLSAQVLGGSLGGTLNGGFAGGPGIMGGTLNGGVQGRASGAMGTSIDPTASSGAVRERATRVTQSARQRIATGAGQTTSAAASTVQGARADAQWSADAGTTAAVAAADHQASGNVTSTMSSGVDTAASTTGATSTQATSGVQQGKALLSHADTHAGASQENASTAPSAAADADVSGSASADASVTAGASVSN